MEKEDVTHTAGSHQGAIQHSHVGHLYIELMIHTVFDDGTDEDFYKKFIQQQQKPPIFLEDLKATFDDRSSIIFIWMKLLVPFDHFKNHAVNWSLID